MAEYIEREALLSELQEEIDFETSMYTDEQNKYFNMGLKCAVRDVKSQPTADVVPKSEYDAVVSAVDNSTKEFLKLHDVYQNAKAEVERLEGELIVERTRRENAVNAYHDTKSEVEALHEALSKAEADVKNYMKVAEYQQSLSVKRYHEIKRLKEDIERLEDINERAVENLRLAKAEVAREIFEEIEEACVVRFGNSRMFSEENFAELKKKYTEEKT